MVDPILTAEEIDELEEQAARAFHPLDEFDRCVEKGLWLSDEFRKFGDYPGIGEAS